MTSWPAQPFRVAQPGGHRAPSACSHSAEQIGGLALRGQKRILLTDTSSAVGASDAGRTVNKVCFKEFVFRVSMMRLLRASVWLPVVTVLALPVAQLTLASRQFELTLGGAMAHGLRSTTTSYRTRAAVNLPQSTALSRGKRFLSLPPHSSGVAREFETSRACVIEVASDAPPLLHRVTLSPRSPPALESPGIELVLA
jgi:hypothetical protein